MRQSQRTSGGEGLLAIFSFSQLVTAWLGENVDASIIFGVVLVNAIIGFIQESKAEGALEASMRMVTTGTTVRRGGTIQRVPSTNLVPGDVVLTRDGRPDARGFAAFFK